MSPVLCRTPLLPLGGRQGCGWLRAGHARTQAHTHAHIHPHRRAHTHAHAHACTHTKCSTRTHVCRPSSFPGPELGDAGSERKPGPWSIFSQSSESLPVACPGWPGRRGRLRRKGAALGLLYPKGPAPHPVPDGGEPGGRTGLRRQPSLRACCHGVSTSSTGGRSRLTAEMTSLSPSSLPCPAR